MNNLWRILQYINYLIRSIHLHGIHSPFVFHLHQLIKEEIPYYCFDEIEAIRAKLSLTQKKIKVSDLGAGSKTKSGIERTVSSISKSALKSPKNAQLLFRLAYEFEVNTIFELGTSFGISTSYMAKARPQAKVVSIEGAESIAKIASINFKKLNIHNVKLVNDSFDQAIDREVKLLEKLDLVFFDGNHSKEPTLDYFEKCLQYKHDKSIFIFDDIYWSKEMKSAWEVIKHHPEVNNTVDLFNMGIVFFRKDQAKEHFTIYH